MVLRNNTETAFTETVRYLDIAVFQEHRRILCFDVCQQRALSLWKF